MIKKLFRDNEFANPVIRNIIRGFHRLISPIDKLTSYYRIYGIVDLRVCDVHFDIYSKSDDHIANEIYYEGNYESSEFWLLKTLTKTSRYFVDVGANTGIFSIFTATANAKLNVLSFEPHPSNFERLLVNVSINKLKNIRAFAKALGSTSTDVEFIVPSDLKISTTASATAGYSKNFHQVPYKSIKVKQETIDEVFSEIPLSPLDVIKIDVEYYELEVLTGARLTLRNKRPIVLIEILQYDTLVKQFPAMEGKISKEHADDIFVFLHNLGYYGYSVGSSELNHITSVNGEQNRNFLFLPAKLTKKTISYSEIERNFIQLIQPS